MGMPGMHGMYWNNMAIQEADLLIGIGMRFDDRVTGSLKDFAPNAKIVHIDIDPAEIAKNVKTAVPIVGDVKQVLQALVPHVQPAKHDAWRGWLADMRNKHPSIAIPDTDRLLPQYVINKIYELSGPNAWYATGVGQHQMWAAQFFWGDHPYSFVTSGGLGTMGFEVPAAIGVQIAKPRDLVWTFCGDGGFQMTMEELALCTEYELPIKFALINNGFLGMVRQWQDAYYQGNRESVKMFQPDFVKIAEAMGIVGLRVSDKALVDSTIEAALAHPGAVLIDFVVEEAEDCYPMMPPGVSLSQTIDQPEVKQPEKRPEFAR
jgi:acetolactate synthase-1/2/3 large subunit